MSREAATALWATVLSVAALLLATASFSHTTLTMTGPVTTVTGSRVCIGQRAAQGSCFSEVPRATLSALRVGDCVRVTYRSATASGPDRARTLTTVPGHCSE